MEGKKGGCHITAWLCKTYALSRQGAKDLIKGIVWSTFSFLALMFPVGVFVTLLSEILTPVLSGAGAAPGLLKYIALCASALLVMFVFHWLQYGSVFIRVYSESAVRRVTLAEKLRKLPLSFFGKRDLSDLTSTIMSDCESLEHAFSHAIPQFIGALISTALIAAGLFVLDWRLGLALFWVFPVSLALVVCTKKMQNDAGRKQLKARIACADSIQECLETVRELKSYNLKQKYLAALDKKLDDAERAQVKSELTIDSFLASAQMFLRLGLASIILTGNGLVFAGGIDLFTYFIFLLAASRIYDPLSMVLANIAEVFYVKLRVERMREIENQAVQEGTTDFAVDSCDICFDHVAFSYNKDEPVLKDVSFTAKQGEVTALVGPSGSGKSTAAKLAARFWDAMNGKITLGGVDVSAVEPETLLKNYAIVFQDVVLFNNTVMENIRLRRREATDDEVIAAAKAARCGDFVQKMPQGYQTMIGENGAALSGGERQRISIARAILKDAPVILMDEATASLDAENETQVQEAISRLIKGKTVLIIAHRMRTVAGADKIVVLDKGVVAQQGAPEALMEQGGLYRRMVELQRESQAWSVK